MQELRLRCSKHSGQTSCSSEFNGYAPPHVLSKRYIWKKLAPHHDQLQDLDSLLMKVLGWIANDRNRLSNEHGHGRRDGSGLDIMVTSMTLSILVSAAGGLYKGPTG